MKKVLLPLAVLVSLTTFVFSQNFGVDKTSPQEKLDVNGAVRIKEASNNLEGTIEYLTSSNRFQVNVGGTWYELRSDPAVGFFARKSNGHHTATNAYVVYNAQKHDTGGDNYNTGNGRFTAPISGVYHFCWGGIEYPNSTVSRSYLHVNGSNYYSNATQLRLDGGSDAYGEGCNCATVHLNAGDWVGIYVTAGGLYDEYSYFTGHLVAGD